MLASEAWEPEFLSVSAVKDPMAGESDGELDGSPSSETRVPILLQPTCMPPIPKTAWDFRLGGRALPPVANPACCQRLPLPRIVQVFSKDFVVFSFFEMEFLRS